jgi:hypothetical protein
MAEEKEQRVNWTPVLVGGVAVGGLYLVYKIVQAIGGENEADREQARLIMEDWQQEFDELKAYSDIIYANGRTPTESEAQIMSSMLDQMKLKEYTIYELSKSTWSELKDLANAIARDMGIIAGTVVVGYVAIKILKRWRDRNNPPPNFPCPAGDFVGRTQGELQYHIKTHHVPDVSQAYAAQQSFGTTCSWVQNAVAVESTLYNKTFFQWPTLSKTELILIAAGVALVLIAVFAPPLEIPALQLAWGALIVA